MNKITKIARSLVKNIIFAGLDDKLNKIPGGRADNMSIREVAESRGVPVEDIVEQVEKGRKIELEHSPDDEIAKEVCLDHLQESEKYYDYLEEMEKKFDE